MRASQLYRIPCVVYRAGILPAPVQRLGVKPLHPSAVEP
jgi:hypothetical protein